MPLGRLSKSQIQKGYEVLRQISEELQKPRPAANTLMNLSSLFCEYNFFYKLRHPSLTCSDTIIPHVFGMRRPPTISSKPMLKSKLEMVESLAEIEIATKLIREMEAELTENPVDLKYQSLGCTLSAMEHKSSDFQLISTYVKNTHGRTHNAYDLELLDVFEVLHLFDKISSDAY